MSGMKTSRVGFKPCASKVNWTRFFSLIKINQPVGVHVEWAPTGLAIDGKERVGSNTGLPAPLNNRRSIAVCLVVKIDAAWFPMNLLSLANPLCRAAFGGSHVCKPFALLQERKGRFSLVARQAIQCVPKIVGCDVGSRRALPATPLPSLSAGRVPITGFASIHKRQSSSPT
jgi:hypothetical protein